MNFSKCFFIVNSILASAVLAGIGISPVMAQNTNTPVVDQQQQDIAVRIQQGVASGRITPPEAQNLHQREREIRMRESRFKSDGSIGPQERQQLRQDLEALRAEVERTIATPRVVVQPADNTPVIDQQQEDIRGQIQNAVQTGRISERQARRLNQRVRTIERLEARFKSDGVVTPQERRQLRRELASLRSDVERTIRNNRR